MWFGIKFITLGQLNNFDDEIAKQRLSYAFILGDNWRLSYPFLVQLCSEALQFFGKS